MGNYHTNADLKARFADDAQVAQLTGTESAETGVPDEDVLTEVVNGTEGTIDSYMAKRYLVPIAVADHATLAAMMKSRSLDISVYELTKNAGVVPTAIKDAYDAAIAWLKSVSKGEALLPSPDTEPSTESDDPQSGWDIGEVSDAADKRNRVFTRDSMSAL